MSQLLHRLHRAIYIYVLVFSTLIITSASLRTFSSSSVRLTNQHHYRLQLSSSIFASKLANARGRSRRTQLSSIDDIRQSGAGLLKLPVIQVIERKDCIAEVAAEYLIGNDLQPYLDHIDALRDAATTATTAANQVNDKSLLETPMNKLRALLQTYFSMPSTSSSASPSPPPSTKTVCSLVNVYSDDMLQNLLETADPTKKILLLLFRKGCRRCLLVEKELVDLWEKMGLSDTLTIRADVDNVPFYVKSSLAVEEANPLVEDCKVCNGTGKVSCAVCESKGYVLKNGMAVICSNCGGKKLTRCSACGGKCVMC